MSKRNPSPSKFPVNVPIVAREWRSAPTENFVHVSARPVSNVATESTFESETRPLALILRPVTADCVYMETGTFGHGYEADKALRAVEGLKTAPGINLRGVPYRYSGHFYRNGGAWTPLVRDADKNDGTMRRTLSVYRLDRFHENASTANVDKFADTLAPIVKEWADANPDALRLAEAANANNEAHSAEEEAEALRVKLAGALAKVREADERYNATGGLPPEDVPCADCGGAGNVGGSDAWGAFVRLVHEESAGELIAGRSELQIFRDVSERLRNEGRQPADCAACASTGSNRDASAALRAAWESKRGPWTR